MDKVRIIVSNLPLTTNNAALRSMFLPLGATRCRVVYQDSKSTGMAGIEFDTLDLAENVKEKLNGLQIEGQQVSCRLGTPSDDKLFVKKKKKKLKDTFVPNYPSLIPTKKDLEEFEFAIIDFESMLSIRGGDHFPCEVGVVVCSLAKGEIRNYHKFIDPSPFPLGYARQIKWNVDNIHGIPPNLRKASKDYSSIWKDLKAIVPPSTPLFAKGKNMEAWSLGWLARHCQEENPFQLREAEELLRHVYHLWETDVPEGGAASLFAPMKKATECGCPFHERKGNFYHCALRDVRSVAYCIRQSWLSLFDYSANEPADVWDCQEEEEISWNATPSQDSWGQ